MVKECLIVPTPCSRSQARKIMSCPSSLLLYNDSNAMSAGSVMGWVVRRVGGRTTTHAYQHCSTSIKHWHMRERVIQVRCVLYGCKVEPGAVRLAAR